MTPGVEAGPAMTENVQPTPVAEFVTPVSAAPAVTYEAPAPVAESIPVPQVPIVEKTTEIPQLQIVVKIVEIPELRAIQGTQTSESLGTAPVRHAAPAELVDTVELGPPSSFSSTLLVFVTAPMVEAASIVAEYVQPVQVGDIITDNLTNEEFAQTLVPLGTGISHDLGHLKSMNDPVSSLERTLEVARCRFDSWALNQSTKHERRQLENDFASASNTVHFERDERDKIAEVRSSLSAVLRQRQCLLSLVS